MVTRAETLREQVMPRHAPPREPRTRHVASTARAVSKSRGRLAEEWMDEAHHAPRARALDQLLASMHLIETA
jgi:hypothetical protein